MIKLKNNNWIWPSSFNISTMSDFIGNNAKDYADRYVRALYYMTEGLLEITRGRDKVYEKTGISAFSPKEKAADALVQILADERTPSQIFRGYGRNIGLTKDGLDYCKKLLELMS
ncbi:MAG: hypothetical protein WBZ36_01630 [Candidatus Nitrosopolaris sp.]